MSSAVCHTRMQAGSDLGIGPRVASGDMDGQLHPQVEGSAHGLGHQRRGLRKLAGRRWTKEGAVVLQVDETRSQARNREIARERLAELIRKALEKPKRRIPTRPTLGSKRRRLEGKKQRGEVKALRGKVDPGN